MGPLYTTFRAMIYILCTYLCMLGKYTPFFLFVSKWAPFFSILKHLQICREMVLSPSNLYNCPCKMLCVIFNWLCKDSIFLLQKDHDIYETSISLLSCSNSLFSIIYCILRIIILFVQQIFMLKPDPSKPVTIAR